MEFDQDHEDLLNSIYPVGKERWIKILIKDRKICLDTFRLSQNDDRYPGYAVQSIGIRDEYVPQIAAIADIEDEITPILLQNLPDYLADNIAAIFKKHKDALKERVIVNTNQ